MDGQWCKSTRPPTSWSAQRMVPCQSRSQCIDVSCGQNCGHCGRPSSCRSQERHSYLTVPRCSEAGNVVRKQRGDRMLTCGYEFGNVFKTLGNSVTKCKAHLSEADQAKLDEAGRFTTVGNERADELAWERVMTLSNPSCAIRTRQLLKQASPSSATLAGFILRANVGERWPDVIAPPEGWDEKDERWKRATPILARPHDLGLRGR